VDHSPASNKNQNPNSVMNKIIREQTGSQKKMAANTTMTKGHSARHW
jgi:hypothetical protein